MAEVKDSVEGDGAASFGRISIDEREEQNIRHHIRELHEDANRHMSRVVKR